MKLAVEVGKTVLVDLMPSQNHACTRHEMKKVMMRLDSGGRRVKSRIRTGHVYYRGKRIKSAYKTREQRGINIIGSRGEPIGRSR